MKSKILGLLAVGLLAGPMAANADLTLTVTDNGSGGTLWAFSGGTGNLQPGFCCALVGDTTANPQAFLAAPDLDATVSVFSGTDTFGFTSIFVLNYSGLPGSNGDIFNGIDFQFLGDDDDGRAVSELNGLILLLDDVAFSSFNPGTYTMNSWYTPYGRDLGSFTLNVGGVAIPEPGTLALLGLGFAGLAASRRRKQ